MRLMIEELHHREREWQRQFTLVARESPEGQIACELGVIKRCDEPIQPTVCALTLFAEFVEIVVQLLVERRDYGRRSVQAIKPQLISDQQVIQRRMYALEIRAHVALARAVWQRCRRRIDRLVLPAVVTREAFAIVNSDHGESIGFPTLFAIQTVVAAQSN